MCAGILGNWYPAEDGLWRLVLDYRGVMRTQSMSTAWHGALAGAYGVDALRAGRVQVWAVNVRRWKSSDPPLWLNWQEEQRIARFVDPALGHVWRVGRLFVRAALAAHTRVEPAQIDIIADGSGAPRLADGSLVFSIAHTAELVVLAVAAGQLVGVDVELIRPSRDLADLWDTVLAPRERSLTPLDQVDRSALVLRTWVRKEAVAKALGLGLELPFADFSIDDDGTVCGPPPAMPSRPLVVRDLDPWRDTRCAVAAQDAREIELRIV